SSTAVATGRHPRRAGGGWFRTGARPGSAYGIPIFQSPSSHRFPVPSSPSSRHRGYDRSADMGRRTRAQKSVAADLAVTLLGVGGFLGFLIAARMDDANASPFDLMAFAWFFAFGAIKLCLPGLLAKRTATKRKRKLSHAASLLDHG